MNIVKHKKFTEKEVITLSCASIILLGTVFFGILYLSEIIMFKLCEGKDIAIAKGCVGFE